MMVGLWPFMNSNPPQHRSDNMKKRGISNTSRTLEFIRNMGWDEITSRPTLTTEPTIIFGNEQIDGGATWLATQNTSGSYAVANVNTVF